jgi:lambda repressor-like predicted transcriptional regulator
MQASERRKPRVPTPPRQIRRRLNADQIKDLCAEYNAGTSARELGIKYGISKTSAQRLLHDNGITMRFQGLSEEEVARAAELYESGQSLVQVGKNRGLEPTSVHDALRRAGVQMRDVHGRRRPQA